MKKFNEWLKEHKEEQYNELFGMFKSKTSPEQQPQEPQAQLRHGQMYQHEEALNCPYCNTKTVEKRHDYESGLRYSDIWQCSKCFTYWNSNKLNPEDAHKAAHLIG